MLKAFCTVSIFLILTFSIVSFAEQHAKIHQPTLTSQNSGTTSGLIAVSPVNSRVVWASGRDGTFTVTTDAENTGMLESYLEPRRCNSATCRDSARKWRT